MTSPTLDDQGQRDRIRDDTAATLFVNAGAGSGKTTALVGRVLTLVLVNDVRLANIAAVTFTEKAGAELRDRLRAEFEAVWLKQDSNREVAAQALDDLDGAAIGTLHSFAQRVLAEHPIEAGLPPIIDVLDEVGSSVAFDERWAGLQTELLDDDAIAAPLSSHSRSAWTSSTCGRSPLPSGATGTSSMNVFSSASSQPDLPDFAEFAGRLRAYLTVCDQCGDGNDKLLVKLGELPRTPTGSMLRSTTNRPSRRWRRCEA